MKKYRIVCPKQRPETFNFGKCLGCQNFRNNMGFPLAAQCTENRELAHAQGFDRIYWAYLVGINDVAEVEAAKE